MPGNGGLKGTIVLINSKSFQLEEVYFDSDLNSGGEFPGSWLREDGQGVLWSVASRKVSNY